MAALRDSRGQRIEDICSKDVKKHKPFDIGVLQNFCIMYRNNFASHPLCVTDDREGTEYSAKERVGKEKELSYYVAVFFTWTETRWDCNCNENSRKWNVEFVLSVYTTASWQVKIDKLQRIWVDQYNFLGIARYLNSIHGEIMISVEAQAHKANISCSMFKRTHRKWQFPNIIQADGVSLAEQNYSSILKLQEAQCNREKVGTETIKTQNIKIKQEARVVMKTENSWFKTGKRWINQVSHANKQPVLKDSSFRVRC